MNNTLLDLLLDAALIQFGWFDPGGVPFKLHLDMLPAYPDTLKAIASAVKPHTDDMSRLVCLSDALPLGITLSLGSGIPLVYSRGSGAEAVHDLVGAYDIGHPALLLVNTLDNTQDLLPFVHGARRVGLNIQQAVSIIDLGRAQSMPDLAVHAVLTLPNIVDTLAAARRLPVGQAQAVHMWIEMSRPAL